MHLCLKKISTQTQLILHLKIETILINFFQSSSKKYNFADKIYRHIPFTYKNLIYQKNVAHVMVMLDKGRLDTEDRGDNFYPSLVGITTTNKILKVNDYNKLKKIHAINNINLEFSDKEYDLIFKSFDEYDQKLKNNGKITLKGSWQVLLDKYGLPATKPPWGYLTNIDLYDGTIKWQVPFGSRLVNNSKKIDGDINFGGVLSSKDKIILQRETQIRMLMLMI